MFDLNSLKSATAKIAEEVPNLIRHLDEGNPVDGRFREAITAFEALSESLHSLGKHPRMAELEPTHHQHPAEEED